MNLNSTDKFARRHIGISPADRDKMFKAIGVESFDELIQQTLPDNIINNEPLNLPKAVSEFEYLKLIKEKAKKNKVFKSYIGLGYHNTITPAVIRRNIFENPGWYTQYTPYQAEIAQGRLEALLNFQTTVSDLTGLPIANASLLDEATAAAEAMIMFFNAKNKRKTTAPKFFVSENCLPQTLAVLKGRALTLGAILIVGNEDEIVLDETFFGALLQYPTKTGAVNNYESFVNKAHDAGVYVCFAADILSLALLKSPGELGADCTVGTTQRFGVPMGYGGPHAGYFACTEQFKRNIPGRIIGLSEDRNGAPALRMALQTREQHIRREKATSNICTAQALLAIMAGMYAVYHGPKGIKNIALRVHALTGLLAKGMFGLEFRLKHKTFFDTLCIEVGLLQDKIKTLAEEKGINFNYTLDRHVIIALDETTTPKDVEDILGVFVEAAEKNLKIGVDETLEEIMLFYPEDLARTSAYLTHPIFNTKQSETQMMRYIKQLENRDLSLTSSMIPLGSCTMKLNAAVQLEPVSWPEFAHIHPFAPVNQAEGYHEMIGELETYLSEITGFDATSLQPNSGAQGEFAGLMVIRAYLNSIGEDHRNIVLIPASAHGTNPASAVMAGMKVVVVDCDTYGNISWDDIQLKAEKYKDELAALMVTYPSTHGVFEHKIKPICELIHQYGGQVYMDGANMNAQVGLTSPGFIGADVCHLNLHKTFAIPHGGGGPGVGPICVKSHLAPFLPSNPLVHTGTEQPIDSISAAPWGSASILLISYAYIRLLGANGCRLATAYAILSANYIKSRLEEHYDVLYVGKKHGRIAHELIVDFRAFKHTVNVEVEDIAKRLIDYGFHAPTVSFPVAGTLMIEPTESEDLQEVDRLCDALIAIRGEIALIKDGVADMEQNVLKNAPHTQDDLLGDWNFPYTRRKATHPVEFVSLNKFWPAVARVNNSKGDRNLVCTCPPIEMYAEEA